MQDVFCLSSLYNRNVYNPFFRVYTHYHKEGSALMRKVNYHTHTALCLHAGGMEIDYVREALAARLDILGFSDHAPFPDNRFDLRMQYRELDPYLQRIYDLRNRLHGRLNILAGLEIEYCPDMLPYYKSLYEKKHLDYLILGQHYFTDTSGRLINTFRCPEGADSSLVIEYALSVHKALATGLFPILAHPDVIFVNDLGWDENCEKATEIILRSAREAETVLELNANGVRRGKRKFSDGVRYPYPHPFFWKKVSESGLPVLINSDCHDPSLLWDDAVAECYWLARQWGLHLTDGFSPCSRS